MISKANHELALEGKGDSNCLGAKPTCKLFGHLGVIVDQGGTTADQGRGGGKTQYWCKGECLNSYDVWAFWMDPIIDFLAEDRVPTDEK